MIEALQINNISAGKTARMIADYASKIDMVIEQHRIDKPECSLVGVVITNDLQGLREFTCSSCKRTIMRTRIAKPSKN